jgi:hypothetical protein
MVAMTVKFGNCIPFADRRSLEDINDRKRFRNFRLRCADAKNSLWHGLEKERTATLVELAVTPGLRVIDTPASPGTTTRRGAALVSRPVWRRG